LIFKPVRQQQVSPGAEPALQSRKVTGGGWHLRCLSKTQR